MRLTPHNTRLMPELSHSNCGDGRLAGKISFGWQEAARLAPKPAYLKISCPRTPFGGYFCGLTACFPPGPMPQAAVFRPTGPAGFQSHRPDGRGFVQRRQSVARLASAARSARPAEQSDSASRAAALPPTAAFNTADQDFTSGRCRSNCRRSRSVIPPQTPHSMRLSRASARHWARTGQDGLRPLLILALGEQRIVHASAFGPQRPVFRIQNGHGHALLPWADVAKPTPPRRSMEPAR